MKRPPGGCPSHCTPSPEMDSLLEPTVKIAHQIYGYKGFFLLTHYIPTASLNAVCLSQYWHLAVFVNNANANHLSLCIICCAVYLPFVGNSYTWVIFGQCFFGYELYLSF